MRVSIRYTRFPVVTPAGHSRILSIRTTIFIGDIMLTKTLELNDYKIATLCDKVNKFCGKFSGKHSVAELDNNDLQELFMYIYMLGMEDGVQQIRGKDVKVLFDAGDNEGYELTDI